MGNVQVDARAPKGSRADLDEAVPTWGSQADRVLALIDELEAESVHFDDELMCWLVSCLVNVATERPLNARDPWSVLLHCMTPDMERPHAPVIRLRWFASERSGFAWKFMRHPARYQIAIAGRANRARRRAILAHVDLDNFGVGADGLRPSWHPEEIRTDLRAIEMFDIDGSLLLENNEQAA